METESQQISTGYEGMGRAIQLLRHLSRISLFALLISGACVTPEPPAPPESEEPKTTSPVIASVNGEEIRKETFEEFVSFTRGELQDDPTPAPRRELFREYVTRRLLLQEAKKKGLTVPSSEVASAVELWVSEVEEPEAGLSDFVYEYLLTQKVLREQVLGRLEISLNDMQRYYSLHAEDFRVEDQATVLEILVDSREQAEQLLTQVEAGNVRGFRALARQYSQGITAESGGDLGTFDRGDLPEEFEKVIFGLKPGQISAPFQSRQGFHLFLLVEWIPKHDQKFYEVRQQIFDLLTAELEREVLEAYVARLFEEATLTVLDPELELQIEEKTSNE